MARMKKRKWETKERETALIQRAEAHRLNQRISQLNEGVPDRGEFLLDHLTEWDGWRNRVNLNEIEVTSFDSTVKTYIQGLTTTTYEWSQPVARFSGANVWSTIIAKDGKAMLELPTGADQHFVDLTGCMVTDITWEQAPGGGDAEMRLTLRGVLKAVTAPSEQPREQKQKPLKTRTLVKRGTSVLDGKD